MRGVLCKSLKKLSFKVGRPTSEVGARTSRLGAPTHRLYPLCPLRLLPLRALQSASRILATARQALGGPSFSREAASQGWQNHGKQNHFYWHVKQVDRVGWVSVLSDSDSASPWSKNGSGEDADPPGSRRTAFHGRAIVPHGPSFSREAALPREPNPGGTASLLWQTVTRRLFRLVRRSRWGRVFGGSVARRVPVKAISQRDRA